MESSNYTHHHLTKEKYLFSEEEICNISALVAALKQIRKRLISEGVDIDNCKNYSEITMSLKK